MSVSQYEQIWFCGHSINRQVLQIVVVVVVRGGGSDIVNWKLDEVDSQEKTSLFFDMIRL